jgi:hypothetical protein
VRARSEYLHYGDRGVSKSSLAATAAYQYQSSDNAPIVVGGSPDETFDSVIANIEQVNHRTTPSAEPAPPQTSFIYLFADRTKHGTDKSDPEFADRFAFANYFLKRCHSDRIPPL